MQGTARYQSQDALREAIKQFRQSLRIPLWELADSAEVSQPQISRFIAGKTKLSDSYMNRVEQALSRVVGAKTAALNHFLNERANR